MYAAIVSKIRTRPHPNADKLLLGSCLGFQVVVSIDTQDGALGVFFPCDGALSEEYCQYNNLFPIVDEAGSRIGGGFFSQKNRRVRAQNFRGQNSEGFWMPLSSLNYIKDRPELNEGTTFTEINGIEVCSKWINPATLRAIKDREGKTSTNRKETPFLLMHPDTPQWKYKKDSIPENCEILLSEKLHGTSQRAGWSLETVRKPIKEFLRPLMNVPVIGDWISQEVEEYVFLNGTRRVLKSTFEGAVDGYHTSNFRSVHEAVLKSVVPIGYQVYFEVVGWEGNDKSIMSSCDNSKHSKEFVKRWGKTTTFTYGCANGVSRMYIYNITYTTPTGQKIHFNNAEFLRLVEKWGLQPCPTLSMLNNTQIDEYLEREITKYTDGESTLDSSHIREGVCLRIFDIHAGTVSFIKNKSTDFYILEDVMKSDDAVVDMEELESYE
jgi:hypothetical protein